MRAVTLADADSGYSTWTGHRPVRAQLKITAAGLDVVRSHSDRVDVSVLRDYPAYRDLRERSRAKQPADSTAVDIRDSGETSSPEDLIDAAVAENRAAVEGEILKKAHRV